MEKTREDKIIKAIEQVLNNIRSIKEVIANVEQYKEVVKQIEESEFNILYAIREARLIGVEKNEENLSHTSPIE